MEITQFHPQFSKREKEKNSFSPIVYLEEKKLHPTLDTRRATFLEIRNIFHKSLSLFFF